MWLLWENDKPYPSLESISPLKTHVWSHQSHTQNRAWQVLGDIENSGCKIFIPKQQQLSRRSLSKRSSHTETSLLSRGPFLSSLGTLVIEATCLSPWAMLTPLGGGEGTVMKSSWLRNLKIEHHAWNVHPVLKTWHFFPLVRRWALVRVLRTSMHLSSLWTPDTVLPVLILQ